MSSVRCQHSQETFKNQTKDQEGLAGKAFSGPPASARGRHSPAMGAHPHQEGSAPRGHPMGTYGVSGVTVGNKRPPGEPPHSSGAQGDPQSAGHTDSHGGTGVSHQTHTYPRCTEVSMRNRDIPWGAGAPRSPSPPPEEHRGTPQLPPQPPWGAEALSSLSLTSVGHTAPLQTPPWPQ